jgi:hypothetical protein
VIAGVLLRNKPFACEFSGDVVWTVNQCATAKHGATMYKRRRSESVMTPVVLQGGQK